MTPIRVVIMGAAGRDFHNFNVFFRDRAEYDVVAFTATQIPNIEDRRYPPELAGPRYPGGIPIEPEEELVRLIREHDVDVAVLAYSDLSYDEVMTVASRVIGAGASFMLLGPKHTMLRSTRPVVAVCAARTGSGKSQTTRRVAQLLWERGWRAVVVRHPMPYGDLAKQAVQRFAGYDDLAAHDVTIEEREEYEPIVQAGGVVFAGVDYERILRAAEKEADVIVWDGGNNDFPFYRPDLLITVIDPHRADHVRRYYPGGVNVRMADVILVNKVDTASRDDVERARSLAWSLNPSATYVEAASPIFVADGERIRGKRVLVVEDGPTTTHGGMAFGAGWVAARRFGAAEIVDPRPHAVGSIAETLQRYPRLGPVLPAMGYSAKQVSELQTTINRVPCDTVVVGTPANLATLMRIKKPAVRAQYALQEIGRPDLPDVLAAWQRRARPARRRQPGKR